MQNQAIIDLAPHIDLYLRLLHPQTSYDNIGLGRNDLDSIWPIAERDRLSHLIYFRLNQKKTSLGADVVDFLDDKKGAYLKAISMSAKTEAHERKLLAALNENLITACILKGSDIADRIYGSINSRVSADIDILIKSSDIKRADRLLMDIGYIRQQKGPFEFWVDRIHHSTYLNVSGNQLMELHWNFGIPSFFSLSSDDIWKHTEPSGSGLAVLKPDMHLLQTLIHHFMHGFREMKNLVDLLWLFDKYSDSIDWHQLALMLNKIGLAKSCRISINQILFLWGNTDIRMDHINQLNVSLGESANFMQQMLNRYFKPRPAALTCTQLRDRIMMRLALDRLPTVFHSFRKSLLPSADALKAFYGDARSIMVPVYYLRFIEWRIRDWMKAVSDVAGITAD